MTTPQVWIRPAWGLVIASLCAAATLYAEQPAPDQTPLEVSRLIVDRPDQRVCTLNNGLTVILHAHRTAPVVSVRMYCRTGSIYEQEYLGSGMSHLFEHLLHGSATATRSEEESRRLLDDIGGNTNAYTSFDVTCYFINTGREHLQTAVNLLGDWITRPTFPQEAFDREWGVVQRELERDLDDPDRQMFYLTMETMYIEHPARYPIIGHQPIVQTLTKENIVGYHRRMYVPDNIVISIVGDIDLDATLDCVRREFASFARRPVPMITLPAEPEMTTPRSATKRMEVQAAMLTLAWPSIPLTHPDLYALDVLSYILTEGDSSRLARSVRDQGLTYTLDSVSWTPAWARGVFWIAARLDPDKLDQATAAILEQVRLLHTELVTAEELEKAKRQKAAEHVFASQTADQVAGLLAQDFLATGDVEFSQAYVANIQKVTAEQIREVAARYLLPQRLATITVLPKEPQAHATAPVQGPEPQPVRKVTLPNGLRCLIRQDPTTPLVAMQSFSLGGVLFEDEQTNGLSRLAAQLAPRGTSTRSAQDIAGFFDSRGGMLSGASGNNTLFLTAQVLRDDFAEAFEIFADVVCRPAFPREELEIYRARQLDQIARLNETWRSELLAYFQPKMFPQSPYRFQAVGSRDVLATVTSEQVGDFYRRHVTAPHTVVAIFGDVDVDQAEALVRKHFGALPADSPPMPSATSDPASTEPSLYIKRKPPTRGAAGLCLGFPGMRITDPRDTVRMAVLDTIISGYRYPTGWLQDNLRGGDRSLVYEVHAINQPGLIPGTFFMYAACQPDKVSEVYTIITQQLERARAGEFSPEELERARTIIITTELMEKQTHSDRAMQAALDELYGLGYDYRDGFADAVRQVTLEDVREVARQYLTHPVIAVVTPQPDEVRFGLEPTAVENDEAMEPGAGEDK